MEPAATGLDLDLCIALDPTFMDTLPLKYDWILLLDADEALTPEFINEVRTAIANPRRNGYYISLQLHFLGRRLRHSGASFWKMSLFRRGKGRFECRLADQDASMGSRRNPPTIGPSTQPAMLIAYAFPARSGSPPE